MLATTNPGGSDLSGAGAAVAAAGQAHAAAAAAGGSRLRRSRPGTAAAATSAGGRGAAAGGQAEEGARPPDQPRLADCPRQTALTGAASRALSGWSPAQIALWSTVFVFVIVGVPLALWLLQRRRRPDLSDPGAHPARRQ